MTRDVYVIAGGSGSLGKATAERVGKNGAVLLVDIGAHCLLRAKAELEQKGLQDVHVLAVDLTSKQAVQQLAQAAAGLGRLRGLVHTADLTPEQADPKRIAAVNLLGVGHLLEAFLPLANETTSAVMISSISAYTMPKDGPYMAVLKQQLDQNFAGTVEQFTQADSKAAYGMSKLAVHLIVEDQAWGWGEKGARLNSLSPGIVHAEASIQEALAQEEVKAILDHTPLRRKGDLQEIASGIEFLLSDAASYITGIDLRIDGGAIANTSRMKASLGTSSLRKE